MVADVAFQCQRFPHKCLLKTNTHKHTRACTHVRADTSRRIRLSMGGISPRTSENAGARESSGGGKQTYTTGSFGRHSSDASGDLKSPTGTQVCVCV